MTTALVTTTAGEVLPSQAHSDDQLIALWLHGKSAATQIVYRADVARFLRHTSKLLAGVTLADLQAFDLSLVQLGAETRKRILNSIKSLFSFGQRIGYLRYNVGAAIKAPKTENKLAERILSEEQVTRMVALTPKMRDQVLIRVLYSSAARVSELCALRWRHVQPNGDSGQLSLFGKGGKTRVVLLSRATWTALQGLRGSAGGEDPVFRSQKGGFIHISQTWRIVRSAARRAGIVDKVSPHWLRHAHASHALNRGASVALVRDTLGHSSLAITSKYVHAKPTDSSALHLAL